MVQIELHLPISKYLGFSSIHPKTLEHISQTKHRFDAFSRKILSFFKGGEWDQPCDYSGAEEAIDASAIIADIGEG